MINKGSFEYMTYLVYLLYFLYILQIFVFMFVTFLNIQYDFIIIDNYNNKKFDY